MANQLNEQQIAFVHAYLINGFNATAAAKSAGYSEKSAYATGPRLLEHAEVKKMILRERKKMQKNADLKQAITVDSILKDFEFIKFDNWEEAFQTILKTIRRLE